MGSAVKFGETGVDEMITEIELAQLIENVKRGIKWLDKNEPEWRSKINWHTLDIDTSCHCIGGQLYGTFGKFVLVNGLSVDRCEQLGFYAEVYPIKLNRIWKELGPKEATK